MAHLKKKYKLKETERDIKKARKKVFLPIIIFTIYVLRLDGPRKSYEQFWPKTM